MSVFPVHIDDLLGLKVYSPANFLWRIGEEVEGRIPDIYPDFLTPIEEETLQSLFSDLNRKYFEGILTRPVRFKVVPLAKNFHGKCHIEYNPSGSIKEFLITMALINVSNQKQVIDTLLHEMIHVWQWTKAEDTGDKKYLDDYKSLFAASDFNKRGHGRAFGSKAEELNALGFDIKVSSAQDIDKEIDRSYYVFVGNTTKHDSVVILVSTSPLENRVASIMNDLEKRLGVGFVVSYDLLKSSDSYVLQGVRVKPNGSLPKTTYNVTFLQRFKDILLASPHTQVLKSDVSLSQEAVEPGSDTGSIPSEVVQKCTAMHKHRSSEYDSYLINVLINIPEYRSKNISSMVYRSKKGEPGIETIVPQSVLDYIRKDWEAITDIEIKRSNIFKYFLTDVRLGIIKRKIKDSAIEELNNKYERYFASRVDRVRFNRLLADWLPKELLKEGKSVMSTYSDVAGRNLTVDDVRRVLEKLLEGTGIMG